MTKSIDLTSIKCSNSLATRIRRKSFLFYHRTIRNFSLKHLVHRRAMWIATTFGKPIPTLEGVWHFTNGYWTINYSTIENFVIVSTPNNNKLFEWCKGTISIADTSFMWLTSFCTFYNNCKKIHANA